MITTRGLVLARKKVAESDVIIHVLTKAHGKLRIYVNGARHPKSRFASSTQLFNEGDFSVFIKRDLSNLSEINLHSAHMPIRQVMDKIFLATYMMELIDQSIEQEDFVKGLYDRVSHALLALETADHLRQFKVVYDLKIMQCLGYEPLLFACSVCGREDELTTAVSAQHGGVVCRHCLPQVEDYIALQMADLKWINIALKKPFSTVQTLDVSDTMLSKISQWTNRFIATHLVRRPLKSLKLID